MDNYERIQEYLKSLPATNTWPELADLLRTAAQRRDRNWLLPILSGSAVGGALEQLIPAGAAIACLQTSIIIIDDMLDLDPRGLHNQIGMAATANLAAALAAAATEAICVSQAEPKVAKKALAILANMGLITSHGQHLDALNPDLESGYWAVVAAKSAPFFMATFQVGAVLGGATLETSEQLKMFGGLYGEMIQIFDDIHDTLAQPANPDWLQGRSPLPILFAQTVPHPQRERFVQLRREVNEPASLALAQNILIGCGAVSYCIDEIVTRHVQAAQLLSEMQLENKAELAGLLDDLIHPIDHLISTQLGNPKVRG